MIELIRTEQPLIVGMATLPVDGDGLFVAPGGGRIATRAQASTLGQQMDQLIRKGLAAGRRIDRV
ncbi:hypothetical protein [Motiliproteus sp.]|uniref:hypothetical protein n=1 Tax=Motiliproteus sp. TaxID=1898955 RepID=UPI003BAB9B9C